MKVILDEQHMKMHILPLRKVGVYSLLYIYYIDLGNRMRWYNALYIGKLILLFFTIFIKYFTLVSIITGTETKNLNREECHYTISKQYKKI